MNRDQSQGYVHSYRSVNAPVDRAFAVFTEQIGRWWPAANTFSGEMFETVALEPRAGGRWFERATNGREVAWGRVLAWEPPHRIVLTWQIGPDGLPEPDPDKASEVEVRFTPDGSERTRVDIIHSSFERHGNEGGAIWRAAMASEQGWSYFLRLYANSLAAAIR
jgi:uncharacterized protein YndB with AHSA1/START domain